MSYKNKIIDKKIFKAVEKGDLEACKKLLSGKSFYNFLFGNPNVNICYMGNSTKHYSGKSLLTLACVEDGKKEIVELLLRHGADANKKDNRSGISPLEAACYANRPDLVEILLKNNANVNIEPLKHKSLLHWAIYKNYPKIADILIHYGADLNAKEYSDATFYRRNITSYRDYEGEYISIKAFTPCKLACEMNRISIANMLINKGNTQDEATNKELLKTCIDKGYSDIASLLISTGVKMDDTEYLIEQLIKALSSEKSYAQKMIEVLSKLGVYKNINQLDHNGETPLIRLIRQNKIVGAKRLILDFGADVNLANKYGQTPLHYACKNESKYLYVEEYRILFLLELLKKGANVNARDCNGKTPLHYAVSRYCHDYIMSEDWCSGIRTVYPYGIIENEPILEDTLLKYGANVLAEDNKGKKPIDYVFGLKYKDSKDIRVRKLFRSELYYLLETCERQQNIMTSYDRLSASDAADKRIVEHFKRRYGNRDNILENWENQRFGGGIMNSYDSLRASDETDRRIAEQMKRRYGKKNTISESWEKQREAIRKKMEAKLKPKKEVSVEISI